MAISGVESMGKRRGRAPAACVALLLSLPLLAVAARGGEPAETPTAATAATVTTPAGALPEEAPGLAGSARAAIGIPDLEGCWRGKGPGGLAAELSYKRDASGTTLMEAFRLEDTPPRFTLYRVADAPTALVFQRDGSRTRLEARPTSEGTFRFEAPSVPVEEAAEEAADGTTDDAVPETAVVVSLNFDFRDLDHLELGLGEQEGGRTRVRPFLFRRVFHGCEDRQRSDDW
jgi:hypothetical protein